MKHVLFITILVTVGALCAMQQNKIIPGASYFTVHHNTSTCERFRIPGVFSMHHAALEPDDKQQVKALIKKGLSAIVYYNSEHEVITIDEGLECAPVNRLDPHAKLQAVCATVEEREDGSRVLCFYDKQGERLGYVPYYKEFCLKRIKLKQEYQSPYIDVSKVTHAKDTTHGLFISAVIFGLDWVLEKISW